MWALKGRQRQRCEQRDTEWRWSFLFSLIVKTLSLSLSFSRVETARLLLHLHSHSHRYKSPLIKTCGNIVQRGEQISEHRRRGNERGKLMPFSGIFTVPFSPYFPSHSLRFPLTFCLNSTLPRARIEHLPHVAHHIAPRRKNMTKNKERKERNRGRKKVISYVCSRYSSVASHAERVPSACDHISSWSFGGATRHLHAEIGVGCLRRQATDCKASYR